MAPPFLAAIVDVRRGERGPVILASIAFGLILCSYFMLRPLREAMGVQRSFDDLYWLWIVTLLGMVAANALYATLAGRLPKRLLATCTYRLFSLSLAAFVGVLALAPALLERHFTTLPLFNQPITIGHVFYVWLSVFNLFAVSLFWAQAADRFALSQAKRLFPLLGAGGTLGAFAGSIIATTSSDSLGPVWLMAGALIVWRVAISMSERAFASPTSQAALIPDQTPDPSRPTDTTPSTRPPPRPAERMSPVRALKRVFSSSYLLAISAWMFALAIASSLLYFTQGQIITDRGETLKENILLFAQIDLFTQGATLLIQLTVTAGMFRVLGVGKMLLICPIVLVLGYAALGIWPVYAALALFQATFRATRHGIATPARESLFTVVSAEEKYVSKAALDTFVYRAGDVVGSLLFLLLKEMSAGLLAISLFVVPLAVAWSAVGLWLGRRQKQLALERDPDK